MTIRVYRAFCAITFDRGRRRERYTAAAWESIDFAPSPAQDRAGEGSLWRVHRSAPIAVAVRVPLGARIVRQADGERLVCHLSPDVGLQAGTVLRLAESGAHQFRLEDPEMARKRDPGPTLFGDDDAAPSGASAYPRPRPLPELEPPAAAEPAPDRARLAAIAAELVRQERESIDRRNRELEDAAARALHQLRAALEDGNPGRLATARAILEGVVDVPREEAAVA